MHKTWIELGRVWSVLDSMVKTWFTVVSKLFPTLIFFISFMVCISVV